MGALNGGLVLGIAGCAIAPPPALAERTLVRYTMYMHTYIHPLCGYLTPPELWTMAIFDILCNPKSTCPHAQQYFHIGLFFLGGGGGFPIRVVPRVVINTPMWKARAGMQNRIGTLSLPHPSIRGRDREGRDRSNAGVAIPSRNQGRPRAHRVFVLGVVVHGWPRSLSRLTLPSAQRSARRGSQSVPHRARTPHGRGSPPMPSRTRRTARRQGDTAPSTATRPPRTLRGKGLATGTRCQG